MEFNRNQHRDAPAESIRKLPQKYRWELRESLLKGTHENKDPVFKRVVLSWLKEADERDAQDIEQDIKRQGFVLASHMIRKVMAGAKA
jgi:hypothetical protein